MLFHGKFGATAATFLGSSSHSRWGQIWKLSYHVSALGMLEVLRCGESPASPSHTMSAIRGVYCVIDQPLDVSKVRANAALFVVDARRTCWHRILRKSIEVWLGTLSIRSCPAIRCQLAVRRCGLQIHGHRAHFHLDPGVLVLDGSQSDGQTSRARPLDVEDR